MEGIDDKAGLLAEMNSIAEEELSEVDNEEQDTRCERCSKPAKYRLTLIEIESGDFVDFIPLCEDHKNGQVVKGKCVCGKEYELVEDERGILHQTEQCPEDCPTKG